MARTVVRKLDPWGDLESKKYEPGFTFCKTCSKCGIPIPFERTDALPNTETCVNCSTVKPLREDQVSIDGADLTDMIRSSTEGTNQQ